jgi:hypothetical protein
MKIAAATLLADNGGILVSLAAIEIPEDTELKNLEMTGWDCKPEGSAQSEGAIERNRTQNQVVRPQII